MCVRTHARTHTHTHTHSTIYDHSKGYFKSKKKSKLRTKKHGPWMEYIYVYEHLPALFFFLFGQLRSE